MIYQYRCPEHGTFEVEQSIHEEHKANCPKCGKWGRRVYFGFSSYHDNPKPLYHKNGSYEDPPINI